MKRLMIAASVVAVGAAALADVYNVKFTTTTLGEATKKVKGEVTDYWKKATVTISGVYDPAIVGGPKYYFWTGSGKTMKPVQNALFEITNDTDMDSNINGKNVAFNVGLYVGDEKGELVDYLVSGAQGKVCAVGADAKVDLVSGSGSFGGTWDNGFPAYGTWSFSKNASATKKGMATYIADQGKKAGITIESWATTAEAPESLISEYKQQAEQIAQQLAEIAALLAENAELEGENAELEGETNRLNTAINELNDTVANIFSYLNDPTSLSGDELLDSFLSNVTNSQLAVYVNATNVVEMLEAAKAKYDALGATITTNEYGEIVGVELSTIASNELVEAVFFASNALAQAESELDAAKDAFHEKIDKLRYYSALASYGADYDGFVGEWSTKITNVIEKIDDLATNKVYSIESVTNAYNDTIAGIAGNYDDVVDGLTDRTNELTTVNLANANNALDEAIEAYASATNQLAEYTLPDGTPDYSKWLGDDPDTPENQFAFKRYYAELQANVADADATLRDAQEDVEAVTIKIAEVAAVLDEVVAAGKDDPEKWVGKAKELAEKALADRDEALAELAERKARYEARIAELQKQIDEGKDILISAKMLEDMENDLNDFRTNTLDVAFETYWGAAQLFEDAAYYAENQEDYFYNVAINGQLVFVRGEWVFFSSLYELFCTYSIPESDILPWEPGFEEAFANTIAEWNKTAQAALDNYNAAKDMLDRNIVHTN